MSRSSARSISLIIGMVTVAVASPVAAQQSAELRLGDGRIVEVIGLRRWTIPMIQDSLARYAPTDSLQSHTCAATLRYKLHFADAVTTYHVPRPGQLRIVVTVREPQDSAQVKYRRVPLDTTNGRPDWSDVRDVIKRSPAVFETASRSLFLGGPRNPPPRYQNAADSATAMRTATWLRSKHARSDLDTALHVVAHSANMYDRMIAVLLLANFAEHDTAWYGLVDALQESDGFPKVYAASVLTTLATRSTRQIDWRPREAALNAILDGTSVFVAPDLMETLVRTGIGPANASGLLRGGGSLLLEYVASGTPLLSYRSHELLVKLRGGDLGTSVATWRAWMAGL